MEELEEEIAHNIEEERVKTLRERMKCYMDGNPDNLCMNNMWKEYKKVSKNLKYGKCSSMFDHEGKLVTDKSEITELLRQEVVERLRERTIKSDLKNLDKFEKELFENLMEIAKTESRSL